MTAVLEITVMPKAADKISDDKIISQVQTCCQERKQLWKM